MKIWQGLAVMLVSFAGVLNPASGGAADDTLVQHASAVLAMQLYSEVGEAARLALIDTGRPADEADALAFRLVDRAAHCSVIVFQHHDLPQVARFFDLLARNDNMAVVTSAMDKMYSPADLDEMQSEISLIVEACLFEAREKLVLEQPH